MKSLKQVFEKWARAESMSGVECSSVLTKSFKKILSNAAEKFRTLGTINLWNFELLSITDMSQQKLFDEKKSFQQLFPLNILENVKVMIS
jgi:hypothetical protein